MSKANIQFPVFTFSVNALKTFSLFFLLVFFSTMTMSVLKGQLSSRTIDTNNEKKNNKNTKKDKRLKRHKRYKERKKSKEQDQNNRICKCIQYESTQVYRVKWFTCY